MATKLDKKTRKENSRQITQASLRLFKANKGFMKFPIISASLTLAMCIMLGLPLAGIHFLAKNSVVDVICLFTFYFATSFSTFLCNAALIYAVDKKLDGQDIDAQTALKFAWTRRSAIFKWALFSATVNTIFRTIENKLGAPGKIVFAIIILIAGVAFNVVTFFALPAIVVENLGFKASITRSRQMFRDVWGEEVRSGFRIGLIMAGYLFGGIGALVVMALVFSIISPILIAIPIVLGVVGLFAFVFMNAAVSGIYHTVLYRYAATREVPQGWDPAILQSAYVPR